MTTPAPEETPKLALRARPPSSLRLSRKVVIAAVVAVFAVVALALVQGLSRKDQDPDIGHNTQPSIASAPPDAIRVASAHYDAANLARDDIEQDFSGEEDALGPPADPIWSQAPSPREEPAQAHAPDPEAAALASPILFPAAGERTATPAAQLERSAPAPRFALHPGAVIRAALLTAIDSEHPGMVIAQVTAPVYDSARLETVLIPQGARLIGAYDTGASHGARRLMLGWSRLVFPDGSSLDLAGMHAADPSGVAGLDAHTTHRFGQLAAAIGLSALISVVANTAESDDDDGFSQSLGDTAAQQAAQTGSRIVDRELQVRPIQSARAGTPVVVLVTRLVRLRPYRFAPSERASTH